eukprot:jgi/Botrbrau1/11733/Bobra.0195s0060.1
MKLWGQGLSQVLGLFGGVKKSVPWKTEPMVSSFSGLGWALSMSVHSATKLPKRLLCKCH